MNVNKITLISRLQFSFSEITYYKFRKINRIVSAGLSQSREAQLSLLLEKWHPAALQGRAGLVHEGSTSELKKYWKQKITWISYAY